jgi:hypothetical protein
VTQELISGIFDAAELTTIRAYGLYSAAAALATDKPGFAQSAEVIYLTALDKAVNRIGRMYEGCQYLR